MSPLELVRLTHLMDRTSGRREITLGLIDGPVVDGTEEFPFLVTKLSPYYDR